MKHFRWSQFAPHREAFHIVRAELHGKNAAQPHRQDFPEVFWIEQGSPLHAVNGRNFHLQRGDLIFIRSTDRHALSSEASQGFVLVNIAFPQSTLNFLRTRYFADEKRWFWKTGPSPEMLRLDPSRLRWLSAWVGRLDSAERSRLEIEIFLLELLLELLRELGAAGPADKPQRGPGWLVEALRHLDDPAVLAGGPTELARRAGRTPQHLNACLRRYRGETTTGAINAARMELAARELRTSTKKILEICFDCGFQNLAHFYRMFGASTGTTPRVYRQSHQVLVR